MAAATTTTSTMTDRPTSELTIDQAPIDFYSKDAALAVSNASSISEQNKTTAEAVDPTTPQDPTPQDEYPPFAKVAVIMFTLFLSMFLVALDRLIVATAIPVMTDEFQSFDDIGWYSGAYLLPCCALQITFGRLYTFYNPKWLFLTFILLFEVGSAVCGSAPSSIAFIMGRVIAGAASAGVQNGAICVMMAIVPLHKRPVWQGIFGAVFGVASILGPLIGGAFTTNVSWRWCYYINLPLGAVVLLVDFLILKIPASSGPKEKLTLKQQLARLDPLGTLLLIGSIVCLLLALQWGGSTYPWNNPRIIALFVLFGVLLIAFIAVQAWKGDSATLAPRIILNRTVAAGSWFTFCIAGSMLLLAYWLPVWFQAIKGVSAVQSGIDFLPLVLSMILTAITTGAVVQKVGYYTPPILLASIISPIGAGLISTFSPSTTTGQWIGYQILFGVGLGFGMQQPSIALQNVLSKKDAPVGIATFFFFNTLAGAIFVSVGQAILNNKLASGLASIPGLNISSATLTDQGATNLRNIVPPQDVDLVLGVYNTALDNVFYLAVGLTCASLLGAVWMPWKKIPKPAKKAKPAEEGKGVTEEVKDVAEKV